MKRARCAWPSKQERQPASNLGTTEPRLEGGANICLVRLLPRRSSVTQLLFKLSCSCKCVLTVGYERHKSWNGKHHNKRKHDGVDALATCLEFGTPVRRKLRDSDTSGQTLWVLLLFHVFAAVSSATAWSSPSSLLRSPTPCGSSRGPLRWWPGLRSYSHSPVRSCLSLYDGCTILSPAQLTSLHFRGSLPASPAWEFLNRPPLTALASSVVSFATFFVAAT